jgi:mercuric ion transport protein
MNRTWKQTLVAIPGIGVSLLPKLACPLCWPAYTGLLSSVGLGFLISSKYCCIPRTCLGALAFRAGRRHPVRLRRGIGRVIVAKFQWESNLSLYGAVGLLVAASLWNAWPHATTTNSAIGCSRCESAEHE